MDRLQTFEYGALGETTREAVPSMA